MSLPTLEELDQKYGNAEAFMPYKDLRQYTRGAHIMNLPRLRLIEEPVILDLGAHLGDMIEFFKEALPNCKIFSAEPDKRSFATLQEKYGDDPQVTLIPKAIVGSGSATREFIQTRSGLSSGIKETYIQYPAGKHQPQDTYTVECATIAKVVRDYKISRIDYCKMNLENVELDICTNIKANTASRIQELSISVHEPKNFHAIEDSMFHRFKFRKVMYYASGSRFWGGRG